MIICAYLWPTQHLGTIPDAYGQVCTPLGVTYALVRVDARHGAQVRARPALRRCSHPLQPIHRLYMTSHGYTLPRSSTALQPSTALYSYTAIHPLHSTTLYNTPQQLVVFCRQLTCFAKAVNCLRTSSRSLDSPATLCARMRERAENACGAPSRRL